MSTSANATSLFRRSRADFSHDNTMVEILAALEMLKVRSHLCVPQV